MIPIKSHNRTTSRVRIAPMPSITLDVWLGVHPGHYSAHKLCLLIDISGAIELHKEVSQDSSTRHLSSMGQGRTSVNQICLPPAASCASCTYFLTYATLPAESYPICTTGLAITRQLKRRIQRIHNESAQNQPDTPHKASKTLPTTATPQHYSSRPAHQAQHVH